MNMGYCAFENTFKNLCQIEKIIEEHDGDLKELIRSRNREDAKYVIKLLKKCISLTEDIRAEDEDGGDWEEDLNFELAQK